MKEGIKDKFRGIKKKRASSGKMIAEANAGKCLE